MSYLDTNRQFWNQATAKHVDSTFYDHESFLAGRNTLNPIELDLLGDVSGLSILHLQCHFGQDTLSLARMGAQVTGVDLAEDAIVQARGFAAQLGLEATFVCCDLYDLPEHLNGSYDLVFTSYGTVVWLPDTRRWAQVVARFLKPQGRLVMADFHPFVWMFDDDLEKISYPYQRSEAIVSEEEGTYAQQEPGEQNRNITWNHGLAEVIDSLLQEGVTLETLREYDYSPYNVFAGMTEDSPGQFVVEKYGRLLPLVYALSGRKSQ